MGFRPWVRVSCGGSQLLAGALSSEGWTEARGSVSKMVTRMPVSRRPQFPLHLWLFSPWQMVSTRMGYAKERGRNHNLFYDSASEVRVTTHECANQERGIIGSQLRSWL